jgi:hypothetical protein
MISADNPDISSLLVWKQGIFGFAKTSKTRLADSKFNRLRAESTGKCCSAWYEPVERLRASNY